VVLTRPIEIDYASNRLRALFHQLDMKLIGLGNFMIEALSAILVGLELIKFKGL
jgi:hypothetical protein